MYQHYQNTYIYKKITINEKVEKTGIYLMI